MPRKSDWTAREDAALKEAYAQQLEQLGRQPKGMEWDPIVAALPAREEGLPARSRKAAQAWALDDQREILILEQLVRVKISVGKNLMS
jgi:uncharacterized protein